LLTEIPEELSKLTKLESLNLADNKFTGGIPAGMSEFPDLAYVQFDDNMFSGLKLAP
jgi:Leucine-rich repeat (LRR) protein